MPHSARGQADVLFNLRTVLAMEEANDEGSACVLLDHSLSLSAGPKLIGLSHCQSKSLGMILSRMAGYCGRKGTLYWGSTMYECEHVPAGTTKRSLVMSLPHRLPCKWMTRPSCRQNLQPSAPMKVHVAVASVMKEDSCTCSGASSMTTHQSFCKSDYLGVQSGE